MGQEPGLWFRCCMLVWIQHERVVMSALPRSMRMACCSEETCSSSSLYAVLLAGGWDEALCRSKYCSDRNFQTSPRCCFGTPVRDPGRIMMEEEQQNRCNMQIMCVETDGDKLALR